MKQKKIFSEEEAMHYFTMILIGLHYLHTRQISQIDLKPENILIDKLSGGLEILMIGNYGFSNSKVE